MKKIREFFRRKKQKAKIFQARTIWKIVGLIILLGVIYVFYFTRDFIKAGYWQGKTLIILTNEAEARPCGGFVTAFGVISILPPHIQLSDTYALKDFDFGIAPEMLRNVSPKQKFWDLGTTSDLSQCAQKFQNAYTQVTNEPIHHVVLLDVGTLESIFDLFSPVKINRNIIETSDFFPYLSRSVSDIDRHDEVTLDNRKSPMKYIAKKMILGTIANPTLLPRIMNVIHQRMKIGNVFATDISPHITPEPNDFAMIEWNLGGAKSSRYLRKNIIIQGRELRPKEWTFNVTFQANHLGGFDEPLSQEWKGAFELKFPQFLQSESVVIETEIFPGQNFEQSFSFDYKGTLPYVSLFRPRSQQLFADVTLSLFPQQTFRNTTFFKRENIGYFMGEVIDYRRIFEWDIEKDTVAPFITLHKIIRRENIKPEISQKFPKSNLLTEIHLSEEVSLADNFSATLTDRDFINSAVSEHPKFVEKELLENKRTLILGFYQDEIQTDERFYIELEGILDNFGNEIKKQKRTVIDRR